MSARLPLRTLSGVYAARAVLALALAWPAARIVGTATLALPRGDAVLFDDGGLYLAEVLRLHRHELTSALEGSSFSLMIAVYLGLFPLGILMHALAARALEMDRPAADESTKLSHLAAAAAKSFGPFSFLLGLALAAIALAIVLPQSTLGLLGTKIHDVLGDRGADLATLAFYGASLALAVPIVVMHDLARAAVVRGETTGLGAARLGIFAFRARPFFAVRTWAARTAASMLLVAIGAWISSQIGVETGVRFACVVAVHQAVVFALLVLRADWLEKAISITAAELTHQALMRGDR